MLVSDAPARPNTPPARLRAPDWRAFGIAAGGMLITFAAPAHRPDLLIIGLIAAAIGILWSPLSGAVLIGALLPTFFFGKTLIGPASVTPPGLALVLTWLAVLARRKQL